MLISAEIVEENVRIQGTGRTLEGVLAYGSGEATFGAMIAGPHPFLGGELYNNVVSALLKALASAGAAALAFNYGGVGNSEGGPSDWPAVMSAFWKDGTFPEERDWADDASSAIGALRQWCHHPPVLIGYSFGCRAITENLPGSDAKAIVLISPNPKQHAFEPLADCPAPLLLIHSDNDFTCGVSDTIAWADSIREPRTRTLLPAGEHFFRGHEEEVVDTVLKFLRRENICSDPTV